MHRKMPRALLLDFGGTLAIERPSRGAIYAEAAVRAGADVDAGQMTGLMRAAGSALPVDLDGAFRYTRPWFQRFIRLIFVERLGLTASALASVEDELFARFADPATFELRAGTRELLQTARDLGLRTAMVSNWSDALVPLVQGLDLDFDAVISSADVRCEKPDAAIFQAALAAVGVDADDAVHAGDSIENDVAGALSVGLTPIWVDHTEPGPNASVMDHPATPAGSLRVASLGELSSRLLAWADGGTTTP